MRNSLIHDVILTVDLDKLSQPQGSSTNFALALLVYEMR